MASVSMPCRFAYARPAGSGSPWSRAMASASRIQGYHRSLRSYSMHARVLRASLATSCRPRASASSRARPAYSAHSSGCLVAHVLAGHARQRPGELARRTEGLEHRRGPTGWLSSRRARGTAGSRRRRAGGGRRPRAAARRSARQSSMDSSRASAAGAHWSRAASSRPSASRRSARTSGWSMPTNRNARRYWVTASRRDASSADLSPARRA